MYMTKKFFAFVFISLLNACFLLFNLYGECITSEKFNYTIDFPEGIQIDEMEEDESIVILSHKYFQLKCLLRVWPSKNYQDANAALTDSLKKLSVKAEISPCMWRKLNCAVGNFEGIIEGNQVTGWAEAIPLIGDKGFLVVMTYANDDVAQSLNPVMISILDSVIFDYGSATDSGLITSAFFPKTQTEDLILKIAGKEIKTQIDKSDSEANQFVIDREWNIFMVYAQNLSMQKPNESSILISAWQRFYRLITKDAMNRLYKPATDILWAFLGDLTEAEQVDNDLKIAQTLLTWVQDFNYDRNADQTEKADITNVIDVLKGKGCDCDSRSMLLAILLKNMSMDTCFFISAKYGHAIFGIHLEGKQGQTIKVDEVEYLIGETTAKNQTIGKLASDMQDRNYWYPVEFYY